MKTPYTPEQRAEVNAKRKAFATAAKQAMEAKAPFVPACNIEGKAYSLYNQYMIAIQGGEGGKWGGFHAWRGVGRAVKKGANGYAICMPQTYKKAEGQEEGTEDVKGFCWGVVFNEAQTEAVV